MNANRSRQRLTNFLLRWSPRRRLVKYCTRRLRGDVLDAAARPGPASAVGQLVLTGLQVGGHPVVGGGQGGIGEPERLGPRAAHWGNDPARSTCRPGLREQCLPPPRAT